MIWIILAGFAIWTITFCWWLARIQREKERNKALAMARRLRDAAEWNATCGLEEDRTVIDVTFADGTRLRITDYPGFMTGTSADSGSMSQENPNSESGQQSP